MLHDCVRNLIEHYRNTTRRILLVPNQDHQKPEERKKMKEKPRKGKWRQLKTEKKSLCNIYVTRGNPVDGEYDPDRYGVAQIDDIDQETQETLSLFTSLTDQACLRDLQRCHCFVGEAALAIQELLS